MQGFLTQGLLRMNRAISVSLLFPNNKLEAVALSEVLSIIEPYINPRTQSKAMGLAFSILYAPEFASYLINVYNKENIKQIKLEILLLFIFIISQSI